MISNVGLTRIGRRGGASSRHEFPSVARRDPFVLQIRKQEEVLTPGEALRELLHDESEGSFGVDTIGPPKVPRGECPFVESTTAFEAVVGELYDLLAGMDTRTYHRHRAADRLALALGSLPCRRGPDVTWGTRS
jgi:hypothetical protein